MKCSFRLIETVKRRQEKKCMNRSMERAMLLRYSSAVVKDSSEQLDRTSI